MLRELPAQTAGGREKPGKAAGKATNEGLRQRPLALFIAKQPSALTLLYANTPNLRGPLQ